MSAEAKFNKAVEIVGSLPKDGPVQPTQDDQLKFYGLFKQANNGDCDTKKPGMFDLTGKYKWEAWNKNKGMSKEEAQQAYVDAFLAILKKHEDEGPEAAEWIKKIEEA
ncbi:Acyl-CoA-binding protein, ACBP [Kalmanozyma brasiliensis GHG001]|uniref:Acyl-coa-binding protein n=1 Tax=Kalmanozyma brasiliensis (strain GHG001) TaxID=1365824 RepID=V5GGW4_KALBG|nr:Acyl-CoA-binding protein, ACBP [Kalmanozyma brasiliensis GHG001]EST05247.1 Acyl-CoA-binding protein, ACBP [Kalmanozyma brasiliensis GHG001]